MGSPQIDVITEEIETAGEILSKLDDSIKELQEQYARMVTIADAFERAKSLLESEFLSLEDS